MSLSESSWTCGRRSVRDDMHRTPSFVHVTIVAGSLARLLTTKLLIFLQRESLLAIEGQLPSNKKSLLKVNRQLLSNKNRSLFPQLNNQSISFGLVFEELRSVVGGDKGRQKSLNLGSHTMHLDLEYQIVIVIFGSAVMEVISNELGFVLHDRSTCGEKLTEQEEKQLQTWYVAQDAAEAIKLNSMATVTPDLKSLQAQVDGTLEALTLVTGRIQQVTLANREIRREIAGLYEQLILPRSA